MTVLASGSKGNSTVIATERTRVLVDAGLSCRELLRRLALAGEDPARLTAILITHEHQDHVAGLGVLARRLRIPVFLTEPTHRAWVRMLTPRTTMTYAAWLDRLREEREQRAVAAAGIPTYAPPSAPTFPGPSALEAAPHRLAEAALVPISASGHEVDAHEVDGDEETCDFAPAKQPLTPARNAGTSAKNDPAFLPAVEYFHSGRSFSIGDIDVCPFTIPHDAADPCGFVFSAEGLRFGLATDLGYMPPNIKSALRDLDLLLLESNHDLEMLKDGPYPWSVKQRVLSRVGHLSNLACAEFLQRDYDGGAHTIILGHLSESNNVPELARMAAECAIGDRMRLLGNRVVLAQQHEPLKTIAL